MWMPFEGEEGIQAEKPEKGGGRGPAVAERESSVCTLVYMEVDNG